VPVAFFDFLIARFSLRDLSDFLLADCRGDLSDMGLPWVVAREHCYYFPL
jgi:hypothetical protein